MWDSFTPAMLELFAGSLWETLLMVGISGIAGALPFNRSGRLLRQQPSARRPSAERCQS